MHPGTLSQQESWQKAFYNAEILRHLQHQIARVRSSPLPVTEIVTAPLQSPNTGPILLLPGAFNPLTLAHLALAESAIQASGSNVLYFVLSTATINKEQTERASLIDRLLLLGLVAQREGFLGTLVTNRGLYVEQAEAATTIFQGAKDLRFVVGFDKIAQIFDPRYYSDKEVALKRLFALAQLLVAPRGSHEASDVVTLMQQPENQPFQSAVHLLPLPTDVRDISSSQIRAAFEQQPPVALDAVLRIWLPPEVALFCEETGCYLSPVTMPDGETVDQYGLRCALIDRALELPEKEQEQLRLRVLFQLAVSSTPQGHSFRDWLNSPEEANSPESLLRFQHGLPAIFLQQEP